MTLEEMIESHRTTVTELKALNDNAILADRDFTDEERVKFDQLEAKADSLEARIDQTKKLGERSARFVRPVKNDHPGQQPAHQPRSAPDGPRRPYDALKVQWKQGGDAANLFARWAVAMYKSGNNTYAAAQYAKDVMEDEVLSLVLSQRDPAEFIRAAVDGGSTVDPTYAAPLVTVREAAEAFIDMLRDKSVYAALGAAATINFDRDGSIKIPRQTSGAAGGWVGEGQPVPVSRLGFGSLTLQPKKMAVITFSTQELMDHSNPSIQSLITSDLVMGAATTIDKTFVDGNAATATRPAGLQTYGGSVASGGATLDLIRADIRAAKQALVTANVPMTAPVWLMSETTKIALEMIQDTIGQDAFSEVKTGSLSGYPILSSNAVGDVLILIDAAQLIKGMDMAPVIDSSMDATINADGAPTTGDLGAVTTPSYSMFQTDQVAIRMRQRLDWGMRHTEAVYCIQSVAY